MGQKPTYEELLQRVRELEQIEHERTHAEVAAIVSDEKLQAAFESNPDPFVVYDNEGKVIYFNPAFTDIFGWTLAERIGQKMDQFVPPESWPETKTMIDKVIAGVRFSGVETCRLSKFGKKIPVSVSGTTFRDKSGKLTGSVITLQDISERKLTEAALRESQEKYRILMDVTPDPMTVYNADGQVEYVNQAFEQTFGWTKTELMGKGIDFVPADEMEKTRRAVSSMMAGESVSLETKRLKKDGKVLHIHLKTASYKTADGELSGNIVIYRDISERVLAEEKIRRLNEELEQRVAERTHQLEVAHRNLQAANAAKSQFLANMSHEIRTPMNGVIAASELALAEELSENVERYLKIIHSSGTSLLNIINDILDFSKIEAGKLDIEHHPFRIDALFHELIRLYLPKTVEKEIELLIDIEPQIPLALVGDSLRVQQIMANLISNAIKFTESNGIITAGVCKLEKSENRVKLQFCVKDTGVGIKPEVLQRLFEPFTQADASTTRRYGGTGLGLTICRQLAELMGGTLSVESKFGQGTSFFATLPFEIQGAEKQGWYSIPEDIQKLRILAVDDCEQSRIILARILHSFGFEVESAVSAREALRQLQAKPVDGFDLIITDWRMPEIDGVELARQLRADLNCQTPIIMMSNLGAKFKPETDAKIIDKIMIKPIDASSLFDAIVDVFGIRPKMRPKAETQSSQSLVPVDKLKGIRLLLAEDNPTNQIIASEIFSKIGIPLQVVENGKLAVEDVLENPGKYDAVLMDMQMPEMDGYEATRIIKNDPRFKNIPIIAMTAHAMKGDKEKCLAAGMDAYVTKPINQQALLTTLYEVLKDRIEAVCDERLADDFRETLKALNRHFQEKDWPETKASAIALKNYAAVVNARKVKKICLKIEELIAREKPISDSLIQVLHAEVQALLNV